MKQSQAALSASQLEGFQRPFLGPAVAQKQLPWAGWGLALALVGRGALNLGKVGEGQGLGLQGDPPLKALETLTRAVFSIQ